MSEEDFRKNREDIRKLIASPAGKSMYAHTPSSSKRYVQQVCLFPSLYTIPTSPLNFVFLWMLRGEIRCREVGYTQITLAPLATIVTDLAYERAATENETRRSSRPVQEFGRGVLTFAKMWTAGCPSDFLFWLYRWSNARLKK